MTFYIFLKDAYLRLKSNAITIMITNTVIIHKFFFGILKDRHAIFIKSPVFKITLTIFAHCIQINQGTVL